MLRVSKFKKSPKLLGDPVGREVCVKYENRNSLSPVYVKYGRDLAKLTNLSKDWNVTVFESALNQPVLPWLVAPTLGDKKIVVNTNEKGLKMFGDNDPKGVEVEGGSESKTEDLSNPDSAVYIMSSNGKVFVTTLDLLIQNFELTKGNLKPRDDLEIVVLGGNILPVMKTSGDTEYLAHCEENTLTLYDLVKGGEPTKTIKLETSCSVRKLFLTEMKDLLYISDAGLHILSMVGDSQRLYCPNFSKDGGWNKNFYDTIHLVKLGDEEVLVSTSPNGIEVVKISNECKVYRIQNDHEKVNHLSIGNAIGKGLNQIEVTGYYNTEFYSFSLTLEESTKIPEPTPEELVTPTKPITGQPDPKFILVNDFAKPIRWLADILDDSHFRNTVNKLIGRVELAFPLVDLQDRFGVPIKLMAYYREDSGDQMEVLGRHWSIGKDCVVVDYKGSVFEEVWEYFLVKDQVRIRLEKREGNGNVVMFGVDGNEELNFEYHRSEEKWIASNGEVTYIYGTKDKGVVSVAAFENWFGPAANYNTKTIDHVFQWNLVEIRRNKDKTVKIEFTYEAHEGQSHVKHLKSIKDNHGTAINFKYTTMQVRQNLQQKTNNKKIVKEHTFTNSKLLGNIDTETPSFTQKLSISHKEIKGFHYLHDITQHLEDKLSTAVKFEYTENDSLVKLNQIYLPSGNTLNYEYKKQAIESSKFQQNFENLADFFTGPGYSVKVSLQNDDKKLTIEFKDGAGFNNFVKMQSLEITESKRVKSYKPILQQNYLAIVVNSKVDESKGKSQNKEEEEEGQVLSKIYLFTREGGNVWKQFKTKSFQYEHLGNDPFHVDFQENSIIYFDSERINLVNWNSKNEKWTHFEKNVGKILTASFLKNGAVYYSDDVYLVRWNGNDQIPDSKKLSEAKNVPNMKSWESFFQHVDVRAVDESSEAKKKDDIEKYRKQLSRLLNGSSLIMYNNLVVARKIQLDQSGQISMKLYLYLLNKEYVVVQKQILIIPGEDISKKVLTYEALDEHRSAKVNVNDLEEYTFKFVKENNKFKLKFQHSTNIRTKSKVEPSPKQKEQIDVMERMMKIPLDFERYTLQVNSDGVICGNHLIYHDGNTFSTKPMDEKQLKLEKFELPVGDNSWLKKQSAAENLKFCATPTVGRGEECYDLETSSVRNVSIKYPNYFISQNKEDTWIHVLKPDGRGVQEKVRFGKEMVHRSSSHSVFVSTKLADNSTQVRPFSSISKNNIIQVEVVSKEAVKIPSEEHNISYEYQDPVLSDAHVMFKTTLVIPGSNKRLYGFYKENVDFITNEQVVEVLDNGGNVLDPNYLKRMNEVEEEQQKQREQPEVDTKQMILDKSGMLPILSTKPYVGDDQALINFLSFEDCESGTGWLFEAKNVVRDGFSATGRNYLRLPPGKSITRNFNRLHFEDDFIFSTWIRTTKPMKIGESSDILEIKAAQKTLQGIIKQHINDWFYIEANTTIVQRSQDSNPKIDLTIKIQSTDTELHVDHVRFTPLNFNFNARVYDSRTSQRVATIHNNGFVSRFLYDDYSRRIAEIDENNAIKYFASYSKKIRNSPVTVGSNSRLQIKPKKGWHETFSPYTAGSRWKAATPQKVQPGKIRLKGEIAYTGDFGSHALCVRMVYDLLSSGSFSVKIYGRTVNISNSEVKLNNKIFQNPPKQGELIVLTTSSLTTVWIEGSIVVEEHNTSRQSSELSISSKSDVEIRDLIVMESPQIVASYLNHDSKPIQEIMLEDDGNVLIRQLIYDEIGRKVAETVWTRVPIAKLSTGVLTYHNHFVQNTKQCDPTSFLTSKHGTMSGLVHDYNQLYKGYPYSQVVYHPNPLEIRHMVAQPGEQYSIKKGRFLHTYDIKSSVPFINSNYPNSEGFRCEEERKPNGMTQVTVFNRRNKKVAEYISVKDYNNVLTTYVYDQFGNQIQMLPPRFYDASISPVKTSTKSGWAVNSEYDKEGQLLLKRSTPDGGLVEFIYDDYKQLRFQLHYDASNAVDKIVFFRYNLFGQVYETGRLNATSDFVQKLRSDVNIDLPERDHVLYFDYGETDADPSLRGRIQQVVKQNRDIQFKQVLFYDEDGNVLRKSFLSPDSKETLSVDYLRENDQISGIRYPMFVKGKQLVLKYGHNLRGEITSIGMIDDKVVIQIVQVGHDAQGKVTRISHMYGKNNFNQTYEYEAPGYLKAIKNPFLTETLYYMEKGYGAEPVGDGSILRTEFHATWHDQCDQNRIPLTARALISEKVDIKLAEFCFDALLETGYFDREGRPVKTFYPELEVDMPIKCSTGSTLQDIAIGILKHGYPEHYGHAYDYGTHSELVAAKHFVGDERENLEMPWKAEYFTKQLKKDMKNVGGSTNLTQLWHELDRHKIYNRVQGVRALFQSTNNNLVTDNVGLAAHRFYAAKLAGLENRKVTEICKYMMANISKQNSNKCLRQLELFSESIINPKLKAILDKYPNVKKNLVRRLWKNLASVLGNSPGDVESFFIDSNGNHGTFYTGFKRFELTYKPNKNHISTIKRGSKSFEIDHDSEGNVIKATHKGIKSLEYDPLTQRVSKIEMPTKNLIIEFGYDHLGERITKRVLNTRRDLLSEQFYVRDNNGNTLVEYKLTYPNPKQPTTPIITTTAYIHGPLGLIGFFRNDKYYSVLLDHEGSTRLVLHQNRVVAAYDYMPYGQLMRRFGSSPESNIAYRYTGQEWDEETELYNYHARLYDPDIGRFYQLDPMEQYPSPYKYAGNSPVSLVDPDGQVAISLIIIGIGALLGAYLGAAAANNSWNPGDWDWSNKWTWIGMFAGALAGGFAAYGGLATFAYFTALFGGSLMSAGVVTGALAAAGAFLGAAASTNEWDPRKWDWTSPVVWNGLLTGTAVAVSLPSGFVGISRTFYSLVSNAAKILYSTSMMSGFLLLGYVGGAFANNFNFRMDQWDWKSPRTWFGIIEGSATVIMATAGTVKHGAFKTHFITSPNKLKGAWYRINIPAQSFTVKETPWKFFITYYKNGQKVSSQIIDITTRKGLRSIPTNWHGTTKYFFISNGRIAAGMVAVGAYTFAKYNSYRALFQHYPNETQKVGVKPHLLRTKRYALEQEFSNSGSSSSRVEFFGDFVNVLKQFFNIDNSFEEPTFNREVELLNLKINFDSEPTQQFTEKLCYSPNNAKNHFVCPQRESTVNVYSKLDSFQEETFGQDSLKRCLPITWKGHPSVACDGQESTFVYTPRRQFQVFDMVDGWLLLARVAPAVWRSLKSGGNFLKSVIFDSSDGEGVENLKPFRSKRNLRSKLKNLEEFIKQVESPKSAWVYPLLEDLHEEITEFERSIKMSTYHHDLLEERLEAIEEDLMEDHDSSKTEQVTILVKNMLNKQNLDWLELNLSSLNTATEEFVTTKSASYFISQNS